MFSFFHEGNTSLTSILIFFWAWLICPLLFSVFVFMTKSLILINSHLNHYMHFFLISLHVRVTSPETNYHEDTWKKMRLSKEEMIKENGITSLFPPNSGIPWYVLFFLRFMLLLYLYFSQSYLIFLTYQETKKKVIVLSDTVKWWLLQTSPNQPTD